MKLYHTRWTSIILLMAFLLVLGFSRTVSVVLAQEAAGDTTAAKATLPTFEKMLKNPYADLNLTREEYRGKLIYDHYCAICHGQTGDGNGFNAFNLQSSFKVKPFNFTDSSAMANISLTEIRKAITEGGAAVGKSPYMPPWGYTLRPDEIRNVIAYIRTFVKNKGISQ